MFKLCYGNNKNAENLIESIPKRCQRILDNNGDLTNY